MLIAAWNVNSLKARLPRVEEWLDRVRPDVLCMQETKLANDAFPAGVMAGLGYESAHFGQGQWNGVAIVSRVGLDNVLPNFAAGVEPDHEARIITATCGGVRVSSVYVPNGRELDHDHYRYKLSWLKRLRQHLDADSSPDDDVVVTGDFNIAPDDRDVWDPAQFVGATHVSEPERDALREVCGFGLEDTFRLFNGDGGVFSWWDYRGGSFHKKQGMRIDLVLASRSVAARAVSSTIDREARKGEKPSDHAPVVLEIGPR
ncbi:MAG: exodeoxyribonuclease III [Ilumatobacteraceae bacterium]